MTAIDVRGSGDGWIDLDGFLFARDSLGSEVDLIIGDVYDFFDAWEDQFDIVICFGVLYHVDDPLRLIEGIVTMAREEVIIETAAFPAPVNIDYLYSNSGLTKNLIYGSSNTYVPTKRWVTNRIKEQNVRIVDDKTYVGSSLREQIPEILRNYLPIHRLFPHRYIARVWV